MKEYSTVDCSELSGEVRQPHNTYDIMQYLHTNKHTHTHTHTCTLTLTHNCIHKSIHDKLKNVLHTKKDPAFGDFHSFLFLQECSLEGSSFHGVSRAVVRWHESFDMLGEKIEGKRNK